MKMFSAAFGTETNTFSALPTSLHGFRNGIWARPGEATDELTEMTAPNWLARRRAEQRDWNLIEGTYALAYPGGLVTRNAYESIRDQILEELAASLPIDAAIFSLHGAMVADGYDDCEGDFLMHVRKIVGPNTIIGVEFDLHGNISDQMTANSDVMIGFKEYPHTDFLERAEELLDLVEKTVKGEVRPRQSLFDCRMAGIFHTTKPVMVEFLDDVRELEKDRALSITLCHGFPWADTPEMSAKVLVVTNDDQDFGDVLAEQLGRQFFDMRQSAQPVYCSLEDAVKCARSHDDGLLVLADVSDNAGGGAASDSTFLLSAFLDAGISDVCLGPIYDPGAVQLCMEAGEGAVFNLRVGGKCGWQSGEPLDVIARVKKIQSKAKQSFAGTQYPMGAAVSIVTNDLIDVVLISERVQALGLDMFTCVDIDPAEKRFAIVKSAQHFYATFAPIANEVLYVAAPGALNPELGQLNFQKIKRPMWPLDPSFEI